MPKLLHAGGPAGKAGWAPFQTLLMAQLQFLEPYLRTARLHESVRLLYQVCLIHRQWYRRQLARVRHVSQHLTAVNVTQPGMLAGLRLASCPVQAALASQDMHTPHLTRARGVGRDHSGCCWCSCTTSRSSCASTTSRSATASRRRASRRGTCKPSQQSSAVQTNLHCALTSCHRLRSQFNTR